MKLFKRRAAPEPAEARATTMSLEGLLLAMQGDSDLDAHETARDSYSESSTAYGTIRRITTAAQSVPWLAKAQSSGRAGEDRDLPPTHEVVRLLAEPNPWHPWEYIVEHMLGSLMLHGNAYAFLNGPTDHAPPREIIPLSAQNVRVERAPDGEVRHYVYRAGGVERIIMPDRMWHAWLWNPRDVFNGQAPTVAAARDIAIGNRMRRWNLNLVKNSARPSGAFSAEGMLTDQQYARLEKTLHEKYSGAANAGRPMIVEGGLKWMRDGLTPTEMDWTRGIRETRRDVTTTLGVAPELMGDPETKTYANALHARLALYEDAVIPLLKVIAHSLVLKLRPHWKDLAFALDVDATPAMQERRREYAQTLTALIDRGIITRNEARQELGWEPIQGADELLVPMSLVPLDDIGQVDPTSEEDDDDDAEDDADADVEDEDKAAARRRRRASGRPRRPDSAHRGSALVTILRRSG